MDLSSKRMRLFLSRRVFSLGFHLHTKYASSKRSQLSIFCVVVVVDVVEKKEISSISSRSPVLAHQNIFIDPIVSARKKAEKRDRHEKREKERKRRFGVNAIISLDWWWWQSRLMMALTPKRLFLSFSLFSCLSLFSAFFLALTIGSINIFWKCVWARKSCF